jgi:L-asparaginase
MLISEICARNLDGVVVTHGTATLEETAWFLELALDVAPPVVLVGAQRPPNTLGSDAAVNLRAAMAVAACRAARGLGVLVVMDNHVYLARDVAKVTNFELSAFRSLEFGPIGRVEADGTVSLRRSAFRSGPRQRVDVRGIDEPPRVDVSFSYAGADGIAIDAFRHAGAAGIVSAGFAPGRCTGAERRALVEAVRSGIIVVQASRAAWGAVPVQRYNVADGILSAGDLSPQKARIALMLALTTTRDSRRIQDLLLEL